MTKEKDPALVKRGRSARIRGQVGEREVCEILTRIVGEKHNRLLGQARDAGGDVEFAIWLLEVKRQQRLKLPDWQAQVKLAAAEAGKLPAIVWRRDGEKYWIAMEFEPFVEVFNALKNAANAGAGSAVDTDES